MNIPHILVLVLLAALPALAEPEDARLLESDKLWKEYSESREALAAIPRPQLGEPDFRKKLSVWSDAETRNREAARKLFPVLAGMAADVQEEADYELMEVELRQIQQDLTGSPTQASLNNSKYFAEVILPLVRDKKLAPTRASLFADLTKPGEWIRESDKIAERGQIAEPVGWGVQDTHALALARAGKFDAARKDSDLLLKKITITLEKGRLPKLTMTHNGRSRTKPSLHREFLLHRALIEALAGDAKAAEERLAMAKKIEEPDADILKTHLALEKNIAKITSE